MLEYLNFGEDEDNMVEMLNSSPLYWNTYFLWEHSIEFKLLQHDADFQCQVNYYEKVAEALQISSESNLQIACKYGFTL